jgi:hypothetical protein
MGKGTRYSQEVRERAVRMVFEHGTFRRPSSKRFIIRARKSRLRGSHSRNGVSEEAGAVQMSETRPFGWG